MFQYFYNNNSTFNIIYFKIVAFGKQWLNYLFFSLQLNQKP